METTKGQIIGLLRRSGGATVHHLADSLGMSAAAVRRHLDGLRAEGWVDVRTQRQAVGRPAFIFHLTEHGEEVYASAYSRLLNRMFRGLVEMEAEEVDGRKGNEVLESIFEEVAEQIASDHRLEVAGPSLEERVAQASQALQSEGIVERWDRTPEGFRLLNVVCPYRRAAQVSDGPCRSDRLAIELLVGRPVEQVGRVVQGHPWCEYVVRVDEPAPVAAKSPAAGRGARARAAAP